MPSDAASNSTMRSIEGSNLSHGDEKEKLDVQNLQAFPKPRYPASIGQNQPLGVATFRPVGRGRSTKPKEKLDARKLQFLLKQREKGKSFHDRATFTFSGTEKQPAIAIQAGLSSVNSQWQQHQPASGRAAGKQEIDELAASRLKILAIIDELLKDEDIEVNLA